MRLPLPWWSCCFRASERERRKREGEKRAEGFGGKDLNHVGGIYNLIFSGMVKLDIEIGYDILRSKGHILINMYYI